MVDAKTKRAAWAAACLLATAIAGSPAWSQVVTPPNRDQQLETQGQSPPPSEDLSKRLDRSQGVITPPPSGDREMQVTPPNPDSKMPVIPPPGSRDGDQTVQPK